MTVLLVGCSSLAKSRFELRSQPAGAEVSTFDGKRLGVTPLILETEQLGTLAKNDGLGLRVEAAGFVPQNYYFDLHEENLHEVTLSRLEGEYFKRRLVKDFVPQSNELVRSIMRIQALVLGKRFEEAQRQIEDFQKQYPNIAASYALLANIAIQRGQPDRAREYLSMAYAIDPEDPLIARALGREIQTRSDR